MLDSALSILSRIGNGVMSAGPAETALHLGTGAVAGLGGGLNYLGTSGRNRRRYRRGERRASSDTASPDVSTQDQGRKGNRECGR